MTREEQIKAAASFSNMVSNDFIRGAEWADNHPNWHKVGEELPPPISNVSPFSNDVIVTDGQLLCKGEYNYTSNSWSVDGKIDIDEITHWMYLPDLPQKLIK